MATNKPSKPLKLLITRPEPQAEQLASQLLQAGYHSLCQPFFTYQASGTLANLTQYFSNHQPRAIIFISRAAVEWAQQVMPLESWPSAHYIAVGTATKQALHEFGRPQVVCPTRHDSEGMLALPALTDIASQDILIVRGNGGRELLAEQLTARGANVTYFESYQRIWLNLGSQHLKHWSDQQIDAIVITSNALLESVVQLTKGGDNYWQNTCLWLVASERIAQQARQLGLKKVICTHGANDQAIIGALQQLELINDR